jgi:hypothetical protein
VSGPSMPSSLRVHSIGTCLDLKDVFQWAGVSNGALVEVDRPMDSARSNNVAMQTAVAAAVRRAAAPSMRRACFAHVWIAADSGDVARKLELLRPSDHCACLMPLRRHSESIIGGLRRAAERSTWSGASGGVGREFEAKRQSDPRPNCTRCRCPPCCMQLALSAGLPPSSAPRLIDRFSRPSRPDRTCLACARWKL